MEANLQEFEDAQRMVWSILSETDWTELWLIGVQLFHALVFCLVIISHRLNLHLLSVISFLSLLVIMYFAQTINTIAAQNHTQFSKYQYFDSDGLFITIILLLPCAFNCIFFIISWLLQSWNLMVDLKRQQSRHAASQKKDK